jgi:hypothetical protein
MLKYFPGSTEELVTEGTFEYSKANMMRLVPYPLLRIVKDVVTDQALVLGHGLGRNAVGTC